MNNNKDMRQMKKSSAMKDRPETQLSKSLLKKDWKAPRRANSLTKALTSGKFSLSLNFCRKSIFTL